MMATTTELGTLQVESIPIQPATPLLNKVTSIDYGIRSDCKVTFKCNSKFFVVLLSIQSPVDSIERVYLKRLDDILESRDEESEDRIFEELSDLLSRLCHSIFRKYAAIAPKHCSRPTLYNFLYLEVVPLRLTTIQGTAKLHVQDGLRISVPNSFSDENLKLQVFKPSEIEVLETMKGDTVHKALVRGSTVCAKVIGHQNLTKSIQREMSLMQRISTANVHPRIRTPTLLGLISSEDDSSLILGHLMGYIESGPLAPNLSSVKIDSISLKRREAWAKQIGDELGKLHKLGMDWGDVKAANIMIDKEDNPWIIDFGGGYTDGWVDGNLAGSVTGDLQGVRRVQKFLQIPDTEINHTLGNYEAA